MKTKTTRNEVMNYFGKKNVVRFGYCYIQHLADYLPLISKSTHSTQGVHGWNCDVFCIEGNGMFFAITTGYRPFGKHDEKISEIGEKYERKISVASWNNREAIAREFVSELSNYIELQ